MASVEQTGASEPPHAQRILGTQQLQTKSQTCHDNPSTAQTTIYPKETAEGNLFKLYLPSPRPH